jgi:hypothetical protein
LRCGSTLFRLGNDRRKARVFMKRFQVGVGFDS